MALLKFCFLRKASYCKGKVLPIWHRDGYLKVTGGMPWQRQTSPRPHCTGLGWGWGQWEEREGRGSEATSLTDSIYLGIFTALFSWLKMFCNCHFGGQSLNPLFCPTCIWKMQDVFTLGGGRAGEMLHVKVERCNVFAA